MAPVALIGFVEGEAVAELGDALHRHRDVVDDIAVGDRPAAAQGQGDLISAGEACQRAVAVGL